MRIREGVLFAAVLICHVGRLDATSTVDERIDRLEKRLEEMERRHAAELKVRDEQIASLREQLASRIATAATQPQDEIEKERLAALKEVMARETSSPISRVAASFNPDIAVIGNFTGSYSPYHKNPALNRFDVGSVELDLRAAVDPRADAVAILPIVREVENPLFFDPADRSGHVHTDVEIEEAYLFLHDFGVPNLTAQLGRYHLRFGRWNVLHAHDWPTVDNAFVVQSFLGPEALADNGLSLSYVVPPKLIRNHYVEWIAQIIGGEGDEEAPVLNNDALVRSPAVNLHALWNHDVARDWNLEAGASWLHGHHNGDNHLNADVVGGDLTLLHTDPTGRFNNQLFQAEVMYGKTDNGPWTIAMQYPGQSPGTQNAWGAYVLGQQQLGRDWYTGLRLDWTENAVNDGQQVWGVSPYITWYWSEFLRFRLEYQHKDGDVPAEDVLYFQATWIFGAHPPHPYWVMR